jgi:hypothetical protein
MTKTNGDIGQLRALIALIEGDADRMRLLRCVSALGLPDSWIGAGFVRSAVWDQLHGRGMAAPPGDIDVVWFDRRHEAPAADRRIEGYLKLLEPYEDWSVKNQAWMHVRNGDLPYASVEDAMRRWPETATAVAARWTAGGVEILAPFGLDDLYSMTVRPTPTYMGAKQAVVHQRMQEKRWQERWPRLTLAC